LNALAPEVSVDFGRGVRVEVRRVSSPRHDREGEFGLGRAAVRPLEMHGKKVLAGLKIELTPGAAQTVTVERDDL
jgi:hypothetical protein